MSIEKTLNELLVDLFHEIIDIEEKFIRKDKKYSKMTTNDMHVIEAIGLGEGKTMSTVAKALNVTLGTLTISVNSLVKKGYVDRVRSEKDRRVVLVSLTKAGVQAYKHHEKFHAEMIQNIVDHLETEEQEVLQKALDKLNCFFKQQ
ncbi:MAG: winged helix-turn-helix transcriptional regulator [Lachnospiraceae bacterium]|nr:winged helix-turn-helix transcriptional regulator [Lachnospiraceae bacterium]